MSSSSSVWCDLGNIHLKGATLGCKRMLCVTRSQSWCCFTYSEDILNPRLVYLSMSVQLEMKHEGN